MTFFHEDLHAVDSPIYPSLLLLLLLLCVRAVNTALGG